MRPVRHRSSRARSQFEDQGWDRLAADEEWEEHGLVFSSAVGKPLDAANVRRAFRQALKGIDGINADEWTPRELRHSFVSLLSDRGVPLEVISRLVGHSGTAVTEEVYRKQIRPVIQTGAVVMDGIFGSDERGSQALRNRSSRSWTRSNVRGPSPIR